MAFGALPTGLRTFADQPIPVASAVHTVLPVPIDGPVTLGTHQLRLIPGNLASQIIHEGIAVCSVMAIETTGVHPVLQLNFGVLCQRSLSHQRRWNDLVAAAGYVLKNKGRLIIIYLIL